MQKGMEALVAHLKEQDSKIEKVSAQLELTKSAPQVVVSEDADLSSVALFSGSHPLPPRLQRDK